jgi:hypothetical protein
MDIRKTIRGGATITFRPAPAAGPGGVDSCRPAISESGVSANQVEIDIGQKDRSATASTLDKARRRPPPRGDR